MSIGFLTVTPNAAIDVTYLLDSLTPGAIHRATDVLPQSGGKGNNVARVLAALGAQVVATGFTGGKTGDAIEAGLHNCGITSAFVRVDGETRRCLTIIENDSGRTTEIREPGPTLSDTDVDQLVDAVATLAQKLGTVVISGSIPPGPAPDTGARLIRAARDAGAFVAFDASGDVLRLGMEALPHLIKPNLDELEALIGPTSDPVAAIQERLIGPVLGDDAMVLLSLGAEGAVLIRQDVAYRAVAPRVVAVNTVGCGDALLAGFLSARAQGRSDLDAVTRAVAVGTAAALQAAVGVVDVEDIAWIEDAVRTTAVTSASDSDEPGKSPHPVSIAAERRSESGALV